MDEYRGERGYDRGGRNFFERAGEEVRSWFGGEDRGRRHPDDRARGMSSERGWTGGERSEGRWRNEPERWREDEDRWRGDYGRGEHGRSEYERWGGGNRGWEEPRYGGGPAGYYGTRERWSEEPPPAMRRDDWRWRSPNESRGIYEDDSGRVHTFSHWPEANYAGRGPKGYRRSDERIREDICERLTDDPRIDASEMEVSVQNGEVMLSGMVRDREDKRHAEDLVERIPGVRDVHNNLRVGRWEENRTTTGTTASTPSGAMTGTQQQPVARR